MKKLTLIATILAITVQSYCQWTPQNINTNANLGDVFFLDANIGWISGFNNEIVQNIIFKTTNGGITYDSIARVPSGVTELQFVNSLIGWGSLTWCMEPGLYKTEDGGFTWELKVPGRNDFEFFTPDEGVLLHCSGDTANLPGTLNKTTNGGETWQFISTIGGNNPDSTFFSSPIFLEFINANVGYVCLFYIGGGGFSGFSLIETNDGGLSWTGVNAPPNDGIKDMLFINEDIGYASCGGYLLTGLYKTTDGADSWEKIYDGSVNSVFFSTPEKGWIAAWGGSIKYTWDGGLTWETQYSGNAEIGNIFFTDSLCGWAVGQNGLILHTDNGGGTYTGVDQSKPGIRSFNIYPNPVSKSANIEFELAEPGMVSVEIYNSIGKKLSQPALRPFTRGLHRLEWNVADLEEGTYFCRFITENQSDTKKLIIVR